jgi:hypothetical protein
MARRVILAVVAIGALTLALAPAASATTRTLTLSQGAAFYVLGHSCGGIQEKVYATGFDSTSGYPTGDVYMQTRCGGSGRGGGYHVTTYSGWARVTWDWLANTRGFAQIAGAEEGISESFSATESHGDRIYNLGTAAYLETTEPPLVPPAPPTGVTASVQLIESGEQELLRFIVSWTPAPGTAPLITSSTVTATPVGSTATVLTTTVTGPGSGAYVGWLQPGTLYRITVTNTDEEGTSEPSEPIEVSSGGIDGGPPPGVVTCSTNQGTIKLSPGLEETPHVQSVTVKGQLSGCEGSDLETASYVAHLTTTEEVTCSMLGSISAEPATTSQSFTVKWSPTEFGSSSGTLDMPITEVPGASYGGTLSGGPFEKAVAFSGEIYESFTGGPTCGQPAGGKSKVKPVKKGVFVASALQFE